MAAITAAQWVGFAIAAAGAVSTNVQANRLSQKKPPKTSIQAAVPESLDEREEEDITLGSDRARRSSRRSRGKRQLMSPQSSGVSSSTGLQI